MEDYVCFILNNAEIAIFQRIQLVNSKKKKQKEKRKNSITLWFQSWWYEQNLFVYREKPRLT